MLQVKWVSRKGADMYDVYAKVGCQEIAQIYR